MIKLQFSNCFLPLLISLLSINALFAVESSHFECEGYLLIEGENPSHSFLSKKASHSTQFDIADSSLTSIFGPNRLKVTNTLNALIKRDESGIEIKLEEKEFIVRYYLTKNPISATEATAGLVFAQFFYDHFYLDELTYDSLVKFNLRLYELRAGDFSTALSRARFFSDQFLAYNPNLKLAHELQILVNRKNSFKAPL